MIRLLLLTTVQSVFLALVQVFLKLALIKMGDFDWSWKFFRAQLTNWYFLYTGISGVAAALLWMYIIKNFPLSTAYPMSSISYIFGMIAAILVFQEPISATKWIGVALIMVGVFFLLRP